MNKQSFFKLPLIFTAIYFLIKFLAFFIINYEMFIEYDDWTYLLGFIKGSIASFAFVLFFSTIIFYKFGLTQINTKKVFVTIIIGVTFSLICQLIFILINYFGWGIMMYELLYRNSLQFMVGTIDTVIYCIIFFGILFCMIKIASYFIDCVTIHFDTMSIKKIYAILFSLVILTINYLLMGLLQGTELANIFDFYELDNMHFLMIMIAFVRDLILYFIIYFVTVNRFIKVREQIELGKFFKSVGLSMLFMLLGSFILAIIARMIFSVLLPTTYHGYSHHYYDLFATRLVIFSSCVGIFGLIIFLISIHHAVKIVFADNSQSLPQTE